MQASPLYGYWFRAVQDGVHYASFYKVGGQAVQPGGTAWRAVHCPPLMVGALHLCVVQIGKTQAEGVCISAFGLQAGSSPPPTSGTLPPGSAPRIPSPLALRRTPLMTSLTCSKRCKRTMPRQSALAEGGGSSRCSTCTARRAGVTGGKSSSGQVRMGVRLGGKGGRAHAGGSGLSFGQHRGVLRAGGG